MDRATRKELKTDHFALEVEHSLEYASEHRKQIIMYAGAGALVCLLVVGIFWYRNNQKEIRQTALANAVQIVEAPVGPAPAGTPGVHFPTDQAKRTAEVKALTDVITNYSGSEEGAMAASYLGGIRAEEGNFKEAERNYQIAIDTGGKEVGSLAKQALAEVYISQGKLEDGKKLLQSLIDNPTRFVTKEQATLAMARAIGRVNPAEARNLLAPLMRSTSSAVSQAAINATSELPPAPMKQ